MICFCSAFYWGDEKGLMVLLQQNISQAVREMRAKVPCAEAGLEMIRVTG